MSNSRRGLRFWIGAWWPVAAGIAIIAVESTKYLGADRTSHPLRVLFEALFGPVADPRWETIHHYIRKSGHFLGYGGLGLAWLRALWMSLPGYRFFLASGLALAGTALVASWDEWHQTFLPNRTGSPWDVLLDCCGALVMLSAAFMYLRLRRPSLLHDRN
jgi:VanZ family protein